MSSESSQKAEITFGDKKITLEVTPESTDSELEAEIIKQFGLADGAQLGLMDEDGDLVPIDLSIEEGMYTLQVKLPKDKAVKGFMEKKGALGWKKLFFRLDGCMLFYFAEDMTTKVGEITLTEAVITESKGNALEFQIQETQRKQKGDIETSDLRALNGTEKALWLKAIRASSGISMVPDDDEKATWAPDSSSTQCNMQNCSTEFTMLNRRHHCRACGALVCGACSKNSVIVPAEGTGNAVRVCDICFGKLKDDHEKILSERKRVVHVGKWEDEKESTCGRCSGKKGAYDGPVWNKCTVCDGVGTITGQWTCCNKWKKNEPGCQEGGQKSFVCILCEKTVEGTEFGKKCQVHLGKYVSGKDVTCGRCKGAMGEKDGPRWIECKVCKGSGKVEGQWTCCHRWEKKAPGCHDGVHKWKASAPTGVGKITAVVTGLIS